MRRRCTSISSTAGIPRRSSVQLELPAETLFPVPCPGPVQRIAADLLIRLPTMTARDQHDARFVLAMAADWPDLVDEARHIFFQRLNLYAIVASYGWPTAIASSTAVSAAPANLILPPVVVLVECAYNNNSQQNQRQQQEQNRQGGRQPVAATPAPAPVPEAR